MKTCFAISLRIQIVSEAMKKTKTDTQGVWTLHSSSNDVLMVCITLHIFRNISFQLQVVQVAPLNVLILVPGKEGKRKIPFDTKYATDQVMGGERRE